MVFDCPRGGVAACSAVLCIQDRWDKVLTDQFFFFLIRFFFLKFWSHLIFPLFIIFLVVEGGCF